MNFEDFRLSQETLKSISEIGFEEPTPIQISAIPIILNGKDLVGQAQTGTGKTAAFAIPIAERCRKGRKPFAIILEPTRELAVQVAQEMYKISRHKKISVLPVYGGTSIERQIKTLQRGVNIIVGTPGRVIDLISRKILSLSEIKMVVLDEADEMLDMGFLDDIVTILKETPAERQTLLFSATIPQQIMNIARRYMTSPEKIQVNTRDIVIPEIRQLFYEVGEESRINALSRLLDVEDPDQAIVFCHTKREVDDVSMKLGQLGYNAGAIHGDYTQAKRDDVMRKFRGRTLDILVATDVAARGLDIKNVSHVINYGIPQNPDSYIHRIGRTGRAGKSGIAITLITPREYKHLRLIERTARTVINRKRLPSRADVIKAREENISRDIAGIIRENRHEVYFQTVKELSEAFGFVDIAAAALFAAFGGKKELSSDERRTPEAPANSLATVAKHAQGKTRKKPFGSKPHAGFQKNRSNHRTPYRGNSAPLMHQG